MTLQQLVNRAGGLREPYLAINIILAGVILIVMIYSGIFSPSRDNYPVPCVHERLTGQQCASCGLSHSFSLIVRGKTGEAASWNPYGLRVFIFFAGQLLMRVSFSFIFLKYPAGRKELVIVDAAGSSVMMLIAFWPYLRWLASMLLS